VIYPLDGPVAGYFHRDRIPAVPVYWLTAEMIPAVGSVIGCYRQACTATRARSRKMPRHPWRPTGSLHSSHSLPRRRYPGMRAKD
jgi:hypothetical protein